MSLVRLLTSGKSLIGLQDTTSRYRMRSKNLLPTFGSGKNPFSAAPTATAPAPATAPATNQTARYQMTPAEFAAARLKETKRLPVAAPMAAPMAAPVETKKPASRPTALPSLSSLVIRWMQRLNPLARWPLRQPGLRAPQQGPGKAPVQCELSLDKIKVARNDLSDPDVEIIPAKAAAKPAVKPKPEPSVKAEQAAELMQP